jgi:hypothetical protein
MRSPESSAWIPGSDVGFGDFIEDCKSRGEEGSGKGGDFTFDELRDKAREFLGEEP